MASSEDLQYVLLKTVTECEAMADSTASATVVLACRVPALDTLVMERREKHVARGSNSSSAARMSLWISMLCTVQC